MMIVNVAGLAIVMLVVVMSFTLGRVRGPRFIKWGEYAALYVLLTAIIGPALYYDEHNISIIPALMSRAAFAWISHLRYPIPTVLLAAFALIALVWRLGEWVYSKTEIDKADMVALGVQR